MGFMRFLLFLVLCIVPIAQLFAQDIYDYQNSKKYAEYLLRTKQYDLASSEYERILFFRPDNDTVKYTLLKSYRLSGDVNAGLERMHSLYDTPEKAHQQSAIEYTRLMLNARSYDGARQYLNGNKTLPRKDKSILTLQTELFSRNYKRADTLLQEFENDESILIREYRAITDDALAYKHKSPGLAMAMSAVVPGTGKIYTGDWKDGLFSMIMIGGLAWQSYRGFKSKGTESVYGWVFGGIGFGFYVGNLYGSFKAAKKRNHNKQHDIERRLEANFNNNY